MTTTTGALHVRHRDWAAELTEPRMSNAEEGGGVVRLTSRYVERDGRPFVPVSGEVHYSRLGRSAWRRRLQLARSGGINAIACYVPWIHHVEHEGRPRFDGNLDIGAFVDECAAVGLLVVLRIGPWVHGEIRNGGLPDWVQHSGARLRTDDPAYLAMVENWFRQLAGALDGRCRAAGPVMAVQIENELYDQPDHIATLKRMARSAGIVAPIWTATAWGSAQLPGDEVLPLFGGYSDGFWVDAGAPWDTSFHEHFFFSHTWDDPGIGADLRAQQGVDLAELAAGPSVFPIATCELGGGMATAYHRRPAPDAQDVAAIAHCKIGNGSAWQGYYMYAGGTNPAGDDGMQESHATGYPNDMERLGYDFHAPISQSGTLRPSHAVLRRQHAFLDSFGTELAPMSSTLPDDLPADVDDTTTLRWALRSDGHSGFVFVSWHQPHVPLAPYENAQFDVALDGRRFTLPSAPVTIPVGTMTRWPVGMTVGGVPVEWATASALTVLPGRTPTLVLVEDAGIPVEIVLADGTVVEDHPVRTVGTGRIAVDIAPSLVPTRIRAGDQALDVLVLPGEEAERVWVLGGRLLLADGDVGWDGHETLEIVSDGGQPTVTVYDTETRHFTSIATVVRRLAHPPVSVPAATITAAAQPEESYGTFEGRASAPTGETFDRLARVDVLEIPEWAQESSVLRVAWSGDIAEVRVDGHTVTDRFWDGCLLEVALPPLVPGAEVTIHLLPMHPEARIELPRSAADRRASASGVLESLDAVTVAVRGIYTVALEATV